MSTQSSTLPIRLGQPSNQPIRRRSIATVADPIVDEGASEGPDDDNTDDQNPETDVAAAAQEEAPTPPPQAPAATGRGRGRPRKVDVAGVSPESGSKAPVIAKVPRDDGSYSLLGRAAAEAIQRGIPLDLHIATLRGMVEAYDRAKAPKG